MKNIKYIVVHTSASPQGRGDNAEKIHTWHLARKWDGLGYHFVILEDGTIQNGRPEYWQGSHVRKHNHHSLGVCLIGMGGDATQEQLNSLHQLAGGLSFKYGAVLVGHSDLDPKNKPDCPGFNVKEWFKS